jgi:cytochrome P450
LDIWGAMYREDFWGKDANIFRPERWLEAEVEGGSRLADMVDCLEFQFGYGRYQCLGKVSTRPYLVC